MTDKQQTTEGGDGIVRLDMAEQRHWVGKPGWWVPCDAMGENGGCALCQELGIEGVQSDE